MNPITVKLHSSDMIHVPGLIQWYRGMYRDDPQTAFLQMSHAFPELPGLMVLDILKGLCNWRKDGTTVEYTWSGPAAKYPEYKMPAVKTYEEDEKETDTERRS